MVDIAPGTATNRFNGVEPLPAGTIRAKFQGFATRHGQDVFGYTPLGEPVYGIIVEAGGKEQLVWASPETCNRLSENVKGFKEVAGENAIVTITARPSTLDVKTGPTSTQQAALYLGDFKIV